jgi:hypothetical protein
VTILKGWRELAMHKMPLSGGILMDKAPHSMLEEYRFRQWKELSRVDRMRYCLRVLTD